MSDSLPSTPTPRVPITPERAQIFLEALRKTGSYNAAAAAASPHLVRAGSKQCSVGKFREYAKRNPEFAEAVEAAMGEVRGRMEALVLERAMNPDERPIFNQKTGQLLGVMKDSRPANTMLALWLSSHDPNRWAPKQHVKSDVTVTNTDAELTSGTNYVITPSQVMLLEPREREQLVILLSRIEELREQDAEALPPPEPKRPYDNRGWDAAPPALPGPTPEDTDGPPQSVIDRD